MKITLGADQYPEYINGAATFTARLAAGLAGRGHRVDLLWPSADGRAQTYRDGEVRVHRLTSFALPGRPRMQVCPPSAAARQVGGLLRLTRPDVVHVQSHLTLGRALVHRAVTDGVPVVATNHFMPENLVPHVPVVRRFPAVVSRWAWRDLERVFSRAALVTAPTQRAVELLADATGLPPASAVSCGLDLVRYEQLDRTGRGPGPTVLFVGRLEHEKHVDELLTAFAALPVGLGARLEVVGMGSLRPRLEAYAHALGVGSAVRFAGAVDDEELLRAYARADLFVMPGTAELQSLATLEAMAAGLPVVAADAMALPHLVRDGVNGRLYRPGDVEGLTTRLRELLEQPLLRAVLGRGSRRIAAEHSLEATLTTFEHLYATAIGSGSGASPGADSLDARPLGTDTTLALAS